MAVKVAVLGGGNGGHAAAADLSNRGFCVHMYEDARFAGNIKKVFDTHEITMAGAAGNATVKIGMVTSDLREAIQDVEFIFVAVPAFAHDVYARALAELVHPGQTVMVMPGTFDSLIFWKEFRKKDWRMWSLQRQTPCPMPPAFRGPEAR